MKTCLKLIAAALLMGLACAAEGAAVAQTPPARKAPEGAKAPARRPAAEAPGAAPVAERVAVVLRSTAEEARSWRDRRAAAEVQAQVADLVWELDASAPVYLTRAWESAGEVKEEGRQRSAYRNESARESARREVLVVARRRAPELAQKWLDELAREADEERGDGPRGAFDDRTGRSAVLLQMAVQAAESDPKAAADLAAESLRDGISFGFQWALIKIQEKDFELARPVFRAALARLRGAGMQDPNELLILYSYLYTPGRITAAGASADSGSRPLAVSRNQTRVTAAAQLDPALALEFLRLAADLLLSAPPPSASADPESAARAQFGVISALIGPLSRELPEQAAALRARAQQLVQDARFTNAPHAPRPEAPEPREGESREEYERRRVDSLEEAAGKETTQLGRDIGYAKAALATGVKDFERGLELAGKVKDSQLRFGVSDWLLYRAALRLAGEGDLARAYELSRRSTNPAQHAALLVIFAQRSAKAKELVRARQWLQEARLVVSKSEPDAALVRAAFGVAAAFGQFDTPEALDSLQAAVKLAARSRVALDTEERAPLVQKFSGLGPLSDFTYGTSGFGLGAAVGVFKYEQFENVLMILNDIPSPESRGVAVLALCRRHLRDKKDAPAAAAPPAAVPPPAAKAQ